MNQLYKKNEIMFAIIWIIVYVVGLSTADNVSSMIGVEKSVTTILCIVLTSVLVLWMKKQGLLKTYGLCKSELPANKLLFYIPLFVMASINVWFGIVFNYGILESFLYILSMLLVGFLEEIIFRGLLFKAMYKNGVKSAVIVSSVTFGIGHIVNLVNGSGADLFSNLLQVLYAMAGGFLFTILFLKTKSLWACIITHGVLNALSVFANEGVMTPARDIFCALALILISVFYAVYILKQSVVK